MEVQIKCTFVVTTEVDPEEWGEMDEATARAAASLAAWNHLGLINAAGRATDSVEVHVDGFGKCIVEVGEEHE